MISHRFLFEIPKKTTRNIISGIPPNSVMTENNSVKPTQKTLKSVYRTYIDVIHFKRTEKGRLGSGSNEAELGLSPTAPVHSLLDASLACRLSPTRWLPHSIIGRP